MQVPEQWAKGTLRFTTGRYTTVDEIDRALEVIVAGIKRLRG
jgi:cysteine desulfurase